LRLKNISFRGRISVQLEGFNVLALEAIMFAGALLGYM
jgi:hypothetical protein